MTSLLQEFETSGDGRKSCMETIRSPDRSALFQDSLNEEKLLQRIVARKMGCGKHCNGIEVLWGTDGIEPITSSIPMLREIANY